MSNKWIFYKKPPKEWLTVCEEKGSFFQTPTWQKVLTNAFEAVPLYGSYKNGRVTLALTVFKIGPFRVAYASFPAGGLGGEQTFTKEMVTSLGNTTFPIPVHLLRLIVSPFSNMLVLPYPYAETWETAVLDLPHWEDKQLPSSVRRNVRKAKKQGLNVLPPSETDIDMIFELYKATVRRHGGSLRYNFAYFQALITLSGKTPDLNCWLAKKGHQTAAFLVAVKEGNIVFYLHGAVSTTYQQDRPGDLLYYHALHWAKSNGATQFNMMASPLNQPNLVRYKEKWGGETALQRTYTIAIRRLPTNTFLAANRIIKVWQKLKPSKSILPVFLKQR